MSTEVEKPRDDGASAPVALAVIVSILLIAVGIVFVKFPQLGEFTRHGSLILAAGIVTLATMIVTGVKRRRNRARTARVADGFAPLMGGEGWHESPGRFTAKKFKGGQPYRIKIDYADSLPDHDEKWRAKVEEIARERMGGDKVRASWDTRRGTVSFVAEEIVETPETRLKAERRKVEARIEEVLRPSFGVDLEVTVTQWKASE